MNDKELFNHLCKRYHGMTAESLQHILCPMLVPILSLIHIYSSLGRCSTRRAQPLPDTTMGRRTVLTSPATLITMPWNISAQSNIIPVSYTHLDVYKRQDLRRVSAIPVVGGGSQPSHAG